MSNNDLLETAIKFLRNPAIVSYPANQKEDFLRRKGLTDVQIQQAIEKSDYLNIAVQSIRNNDGRPVTSLFSSIRNGTQSLLFVGGCVYGLYLLYKTFMKTYFANNDDQVTEYGKDTYNIDAEKSSVEESNVKLSQAISNLQSQLNEMSSKVEKLTLLFECNKFNELKSEVSSIKKLLLNRNQFANTSEVPKKSPPVPDWQVEAVKGQSVTENTDDSRNMPILDSTNPNSILYPRGFKFEDLQKHAKNAKHAK